MNRKGWINVIEAVISIVILFTFLFLALEQKPEEKSETDFFSLNKMILEQVNNNQDLRKDILAKNENSVNTTLVNLVNAYNKNIGIDICIANISERCPITLQNKDVFTSDFYISSNSTKYEPKKLKVFLWLK